MPAPPQGLKQPHKGTRGGFQSATFYSGAVAASLNAAPGAVAVGSDVLLCSGAGRLDSILIHQHTAQSGLLIPVVFYDAAAPVSGGPLLTSGHKLVGFTPALINLISGFSFTSGNVTAFQIPLGQSILCDMPFQSGLCVNLRSGQPGVTVCWSPEIAGQ